VQEEAERPESRAVAAGLSRQGAEFISRFEGCVLHLYNDPTRNATIGIGHLVHPGAIDGSEPAEFKNGISRERALELLMQDSSEAATAVRRGVTVPLTQHELDALISFVFNVGAGNFQASTLRRRLNGGDRNAVSEELMRWTLSNNQRLPGLVRRRQAEGKLFARGQYA
jgi:lysozyme